MGGETYPAFCTMSNLEKEINDCLCLGFMVRFARGNGIGSLRVSFINPRNGCEYWADRSHTQKATVQQLEPQKLADLLKSARVDLEEKMVKQFGLSGEEVASG